MGNSKKLLECFNRSIQIFTLKNAGVGDAGTRLICWSHVNRKLRPRLVNEPLIADEPMIPEVLVGGPVGASKENATLSH